MDARRSGMRGGQSGGRGRNSPGQPPSGKGPGSSRGDQEATRPAPPRHYPIPRETRSLLSTQPAKALQHPGLAFQRLIWYAKPWEMDQKHQQDILKELASQSQNLGKPPGLLARALQELHARVEGACQSLRKRGWHARSFSATVEWRLVTGLGAASVLEGSGMVLHRLYGFPYLPGTSLKGLVRHYLWLNGHINEDDPLLIRIFGSQEQRGEILFWDGLPESWPVLDVDITNVHYRDYYMSDAPQPPGDYMSPKPVYFLTVASGTRFRFTLLAKRPDLLEQAVECTKKAIELLGVGAKTRAGYGGMSPAEG